MKNFIFLFSIFTSIFTTAQERYISYLDAGYSNKRKKSEPNDDKNKINYLASNYILSESALMPEKKTFYYSNNVIAAGRYGYGFTDNICLEIGTFNVIPLIFFSTSSKYAGAFSGLKIGTKLSDKFSISGKAYALVMGDDYDLFSAYTATLSYGTTNENLSVGYHQTRDYANVFNDKINKVIYLAGCKIHFI